MNDEFYIKYNPKLNYKWCIYRSGIVFNNYYTYQQARSALNIYNKDGGPYQDE